MKARTAAIFLIPAIFLGQSISAQVLTAEAGTGRMICPGTTANLGGSPTASGGTSPYTYHWTPSGNISSTTSSNPIANPVVPTWYFVTVTDNAGNTATDSVFINLDPIYANNAGNDTSICINSTGTLGGMNNSTSGGVSFTWSPGASLDNPNAPRPVTSATTTTTYSLTITSTASTPNCPSKSYTVTVTVNPLPVVDACCFTTINEGESTVLNATGATDYNWAPSNTLSAGNMPSVTAEPVTTTQYAVWGTDVNGCTNWDTVTVIVIPSSEIVYYNTFSPNGDGINDFFYIGNAGKYPNSRLEVYTRTGQLVYAKTGYDNSWDGTNYGDKLPEATYYYRFDPGDGSPPHFGNVTIVR
ncbi:MAG TPA: gliding motility-associated C-terminal domain-containing protein [Bacteroidia bacterium]|nr:gliding motility-associated C-terminal domain-containing protein [Bacteroidia bacterium]